MTRFAKYLCLCASAVFFSALVSHAQKPALVQNVDEKGRTPYQQTAGISQCPNVNEVCTVTFRPVPAGFRLVVTHVSVFATVTGSTSNAYIVLRGGNAIPGPESNFYTDLFFSPTFNTRRVPSTLT